MLELPLDHITITTFVLAYVSGVLTSFTPCLYPLLPIVVGFLGSASGSVSARVKSALSYALGLALVYTALGITAALTGRMFGDLTTNAWVYLAFGIFVLILGGNMMDFYSLPLPGFRNSGSPKNAFVLGMTSGLVASPCTAPVLASLLFYVAKERAVVVGGLLLFTFAIGLNTTLLAIGLSSGLLARLPKSGRWMVRVKRGMALLMIAGAIYFIFKAGTLA